MAMKSLPIDFDQLLAIAYDSWMSYNARIDDRE
jgi:hypothetical protein